MFSEIGFGIQSARVVYYNLCFDGIYGIQIIVKNGSITEESLMRRLSKDEEIAKAIIKFLYENSVSIVHVEDIINDLLEKIENESKEIYLRDA